MFVGPIFSREALTVPRRLQHFLIRSGYIAALFVLMYTAGQATFGWQIARNVGDIARFGNLVFQIFSLVQLSLVLFFALLFSAGNVAQEKDKQTLILLLVTDLRDHELVLGKLFSSLLLVGVLIAASLPVFVFVHLLGGVSMEQIGWVMAICTASALVAGSWASLVAFWRDKTFQTLAISVLGVVLFIGILEAVIVLAGSSSPLAEWAGILNPYRILLSVLNPLADEAGLASARQSILTAVITMTVLAVLLDAYTIFRLRIWNPAREVYKAPSVEPETAETRQQHRKIWNTPVIWREVMTRAYGRKVFVIKLAYIAIALFAAYSIISSGGTGELILGMISPAGFAFVGLGLLSLLLINAQAVTAFTGERDGKTLELLLMTDVTAQEFIYGKLGGVLYNTKELVLIPLALVGYFVFMELVSLEQFVYLTIGFLVLIAFASMLGLHAGLSYDNSRSSIANSLGTMFFLFIGIFIFIMLLVEARSSFAIQFQSFIVFIGVGSVALNESLTHKNPSIALKIAAGILPFLTFYALTEFLLNGSLGVCLSISIAYGFTTLAMLIPAVSDFDVALGRTTSDHG